MIYWVADIDQVWEEVSPLLEKALARSNGEMWLEDVYDRCKDNRMNLLIAVIEKAIVAAFVTEVVDYPRKRALRLVLGGGAHLKEWGPHLNEFMEIGAKAIGADLIEVHGRKGWMRYLKSLCNAKTETVLMTRAVQ